MRELGMMKLLQRITAAVFTVTMLILAACGEDEPKVDPVTVEFNSPTSRSVDEDFADAVVINIKLSGAATKSGTLSVSATSTVGNAADHVTFNEEISIEKGNTAAQLVVNLKDNNAIDGAKTITFTLADPSSGFVLGTAKTYTLVINDDEGPTTANFAVGSASIGEGNTEGVTVVINLTPAATAAGSIQITMDPANAPVTTTPAATAGVITVTVPDNATTVSFTVVPTDNDDPNENVEVGFEITGSNGGVQIGTLKEYVLTITDDDAVEPTPIAEVRAMYGGTGTQNITTPLLIRGIITSMNPQTNANNIWVQDATGGIVVRFKAANNNQYKRGDEVIVNLEGANFASFSGLIQVENVEKADATTLSDKVEVVSENNTLPTPEVVTFTQLKTDDYQGKLVAVENVSFVDADGVLTMNGTRAITDGTETVNVRTESGAPFSGSVMPLGSGTVKGLAGINAGVVQIIPVVFAEDVFANNPVGTIGVTQIPLTDFGSVDNGQESTEQSYTVQGTTLNNDIVITASAGYKVSLAQAGTYGSTVTILAANANSATTVYVKFAPASGVNGVINGSITHKSQGAATVDFDVTGTEAGNETSSLLLIENFDYGTSAGNVSALASTWIAHSGAGSNQVLYNTTSLTMAGYPGSGVGGAAQLRSPIGAEDINRAFTAQTTGVVYVAALINLSAAAASSPGYFYHLSDGGTSNFAARFFAQEEGTGKYKLGMSKRGTPTVFPAAGLDYGTTYIIVIKFELDGNNDNSNDVASFYLLTAPVSTEPTTTTQTDATGADFSISAVAIRQAAGCPPGAIIDGIRVANTWADLFN